MRKSPEERLEELLIANEIKDVPEIMDTLKEMIDEMIEDKLDREFRRGDYRSDW